ncbi:hypothetical protein D8674_012001 [Pyrus ussuriensis x Pyrus communis]|uniref:Uncharacterized protein n=1 Tax=Pyrus ussuriensis x Pyrus communis TaxID=2448454 RepID=A0A5N5G0F7_9ROSA|nr:hypothetical protein D8674_012001 [Pyrus ussuriensis x Pyrus communis]
MKVEYNPEHMCAHPKVHMQLCPMTTSKWKSITTEVKEAIKAVLMCFKEWKYKLRMHYRTLETHEEALNNSLHGFEHRMNK